MQNAEEENCEKVTSDDVFKKIGEFVSLTATRCAIATYQTAFTEATPKFRCKIPNLESDTYEITSPDHQKLVDLYIPKDELSNTQYKGCSIRSFASLNASEVECNSWVYSKEFYERTLVTEWDLVCSNAEDKGHFRSLYFAGTFGVILIGLLSDRYGRQRITHIFLILNVLVFIMIAFSLSLITNKEVGKATYATLRFLIGFTSNIYGVTTVLVLELVGPNYRVLTNNIMNYFYILGEFVVLFFAYFVRDYSYLNMYLTILVSILITYFWWIPESVRYLIGRKQYDKADAIFKRIARSNNKVYSYSAALLYNEDNNDQNKNKVSFKVFFTNKKILGRILVSILQWTTNPFVYYGLSLSTDVLGGNPYLNYLLSSIVELAGALACQYFLQKVGRKLPYFINFLMVAVSLIAIGFVPENMTWLIVILFLIGKFSISFNFNAIYIITAESYPTIIRNSIMSVCSASGRIGAMLSPYVSLLAAYWTPLPFVLFGACSAFAGILDFLIRPETKDVDLPESLADIIPSSSHVKKNKEFELQHQQSNDS